MSAVILDGKALAQECEHKLRPRAMRLSEALKAPPILATIVVGDDSASHTYVRMKGRACERVGLLPKPIALAKDTSTKYLLELIRSLNEDTQVCGILLQHPVPAQIDERLCFDAIHPDKDVDGVGCLGFGRMSMGLHAWGAATPAGIMRLLKHYKMSLSGKHAVVVGRSPILGKPMAMMLLNAHCTVSICHSRTTNIDQMIHSADIVVGALGKPKWIQSGWLRQGVIAIDAGYHAEGCGDIDLENIQSIASAYTPVPGGVGPMTINTLISQAIESAEQTHGIRAASKP